MRIKDIKMVFHIFFRANLKEREISLKSKKERKNSQGRDDLSTKCHLQRHKSKLMRFDDCIDKKLKIKIVSITFTSI